MFFWKIFWERCGRKRRNSKDYSIVLILKFCIFSYICDSYCVNMIHGQIIPCFSRLCINIWCNNHSWSKYFLCVNKLYFHKYFKIFILFCVIDFVSLEGQILQNPCNNSTQLLVPSWYLSNMASIISIHTIHFVP